MTTPTRDRVREAREAVKVAAQAHWDSVYWQAAGREAEVEAALDAFRDALLDAVDEDVAGLRQTHPTIAGIAYDAGITDARAAIRARKETT